MVVFIINIVYYLGGNHKWWCSLLLLLLCTTLRAIRVAVANPVRRDTRATATLAIMAGHFGKCQGQQGHLPWSLSLSMASSPSLSDQITLNSVWEQSLGWHPASSLPSPQSSSPSHWKTEVEIMMDSCIKNWTFHHELLAQLDYHLHICQYPENRGIYSIAIW